MSDVFLSYARPDQALAEKMARCLADAGFTVWWDSELLPHNRFASAIENEIRSAKAVLVVWSEAAVQSQWVRAEAELAREQEKLIQVVVDQAPVPLPFNQFHVVGLSRWHGDADDPRWRKVLSSVSHFTREPQSEALEASPANAPLPAAHLLRSRQIIFFATAGLVLAALTAILAWSLRPGESRGQRIVVQPFRSIGGTSQLRDFATELSEGLQDDLTQAQFQTVPSSEIDALAGDRLARRLKALDVGLMFNGTVQTNGPDVTVSMRLDNPVRHATLWSAEMKGATVSFEQVQARVRALTVAVLNCSAQGLAPSARLTDSALQAFLHACELSETADHGTADQRSAYAMLDAMRKAAHAAPNFAAAHSVLAKHLAFVFRWMPSDQAASLRSEAEREAQRALELDPKDPDAYVAFGLLTPTLEFAKREALFRKALASNPAWPHANGFLGNVMADTGRLQDAVALYQRAASANPQSVDWSVQSAWGMILVGQTALADRELARLSQLWPDDSQAWYRQLESMLAQKRWTDALKLLDRADDYPSSVSPEYVAGMRSLLSALQSNDIAQRQSLRESLLGSSGSQPQTAISRLALLGFVDDAFAVAQKELREAPGHWDDTSFLFEPETAALRHDPRFIALAARYGLVDYWRTTGRWADFCEDQNLPYSCKQEAARLSQRHH